MRMNRWPFEAFGSIELITSRPQIENGHGANKTFKDIGGV